MNTHFPAKTLLALITSGVMAVAVAQSPSKSGTANSGQAAKGPRELFNDPAVLFKWLDTDKDGKLSPEEFQRILNVTGWPGGSAGSTGTEGPGPSASAGEPPAKTGGGK